MRRRSPPRRWPWNSPMISSPGKRFSISRRPSGTSLSFSFRPPTPTAIRWSPSGIANTSARRSKAATCPGFTTTTRAITTTATGSCSTWPKPGRCRGCFTTTGSRRFISTNTRWARRAHDSSSRPTRTRPSRMSTPSSGGASICWGRPWPMIFRAPVSGASKTAGFSRAGGSGPAMIRPGFTTPWAS